MTVSVRVLPRFPARVTVGAGLDVARANGVYTFSLDFQSLNPATAISDPDALFIPAWDSVGDTYGRYSASSFGQAMAAGFSGVSPSSVEVGTGAKNFTASVGKAWSVAQRLRVSSDDGTKVMSGPVTSYNAVSGALVLEVDYTLGSGTHADWNISVGGEPGPEGAPGEGNGDVVGPTGSTDGNIALFDGATGLLLKEASGPPGALAFLATVGTSQIDDEAVTYAKMQHVSATDKLLGRSTSGAGDVEEITCVAAARTFLATPTFANVTSKPTTLAGYGITDGAAQPVGTIVVYGGATAPTGWLLSYGQAISRTTYSALFAIISTTYGAGDGSTTFNLPDLRGRVVAGQDDMGGSSANRLTNQSGGLNGDTLGATGGAETHTLLTAEMPAHTHDYRTISSIGSGTALQTSDNAGAASVTQSTGGDGAHNNVQPTIILNYIIYTGVA